MLTCKFSKILVTLALVTSGAQFAYGFFAEEKLYPIENIIIEAPEKVAPAAAESLDSANPFLPFLPKISAPEIERVGRPSADIENLVARFDARNLEVSLLASASELPAAKIENCKSLVEATLAALPENLTESLDEMKLIFAERKMRGLANGHLIELRCDESDDAELVAVLVHELGHVVDLGKLRGNSLAASEFADGKIQISADDQSIQFYKLSWRDESTKNYLAERRDFVSGYAMTDPFEDFAESFNFFVLHGADFRAIKSESSVLAAKYDFLKNEIFAGVEFASTIVGKPGKRVWDATLIDFDLGEFFARS